MIRTVAQRTKLSFDAQWRKLAALSLPNADALIAGAVFVIFAGALLALRPWDRWSQGDAALFQVFGRLVADGKVPYRDFFDQKTPLASYLNAIPALSSRWFDTDLILGARTLSIVLTATASAGLYLLGRSVSMSRLASLAAAAIWPAFDLLDYFSILGIEPKVLNSVMGIIALVAAYRSKWVVAGVFCALAFLSWQPGGIFLVGVLAAVLLNERAQWRRASLRVVAGFFAPILVLLLYFALAGALSDTWADTVTFNRGYVERQFTWTGPIQTMADNINSTYNGDRWLFLVGAGGFAVWCVLIAVGLATRRLDKSALLAAPIALVTIGVMAYSYVNYTNESDLIPFAPWIALWGGWLLDRSSRAFRPLAPVAAALGLALLVGYGHHSFPDLYIVGGFPDEQAIVDNIEQRAGLQPGDPIYVENEAWFLLLSGRQHLSRYYYLRSRAYEFAAEREGIDAALLRPLYTQQPKLVVLSRQPDWLNQAGWTAVQRIYGPLLLSQYEQLDPKSITYGFSRRAEFWVLRTDDRQNLLANPGTATLDHWASWQGQLGASNDGITASSTQTAYAVYQETAPLPITAEGQGYVGIVQVKATADSLGEAVAIGLRDGAGPESRNVFTLTDEWQTIVVAHAPSAPALGSLMLYVQKQNDAGSADSFMVRQPVLTLFGAAPVG